MKNIMFKINDFFLQYGRKCCGKRKPIFPASPTMFSKGLPSRFLGMLRLRGKKLMSVILSEDKSFNSLQNGKLLALTKLKAFADNKFHFVECDLCLS